MITKTVPHSLLEQFYSICKYNDYDPAFGGNAAEYRDIVITPYLASYGAPAGQIVAIEGTPPRAVLHVPKGMRPEIITYRPVLTIGNHVSILKNVKTIQKILDALQSVGAMSGGRIMDLAMTLKPGDLLAPEASTGDV